MYLFLFQHLSHAMYTGSNSDSPRVSIPDVITWRKIYSLLMIGKKDDALKLSLQAEKANSNVPEPYFLKAMSLFAHTELFYRERALEALQMGISKYKNSSQDLTGTSSGFSALSLSQSSSQLSDHIHSPLAS